MNHDSRLPDSYDAGSYARDQRREHADEVRSGQIDTLADELYLSYLTDDDKVHECLTADTNILADISEAFASPDKLIVAVIHKYLRELAEADAEEQMGDR